MPRPGKPPELAIPVTSLAALRRAAGHPDDGPHLFQVGLAVFAEGQVVVEPLVARAGPGQDPGQQRSSQSPAAAMLKIAEVLSDRIDRLTEKVEESGTGDLQIEIPAVVSNGFIAVEDRRFWQHDGVDARQLAPRAVDHDQEGVEIAGLVGHDHIHHIARLRATIETGGNPHGLTYWPQPGTISLGHNGNMR